MLSPNVKNVVRNILKECEKGVSQIPYSIILEQEVRDEYR